MQETLNQVQNWAHENKLRISSEKSKSVFFSNRRCSPPELFLQDEQIENVKNFKFLGIIFDRHLTWKEHIKKLKERCMKDIRLLNLISWRGWGALTRHDLLQRNGPLEHALQEEQGQGQE